MAVDAAGGGHFSARRGRFIPAWMGMVLLALSAVTPLIFVVSTALKTNAAYQDDSFGLTTHLTLANVRTALTTAGFDRYLLNTVGVVGVAVLCTLVLASMAGFAFTFLPFPGRGGGLLSVIALMILPPAVLAVPTFQLILDLGLLNSYAGLTLVYITISLPFGIYLMASFFRGVPGELLDAAWIDGASVFQAFRLIALPLAKPALKTLTVLTSLSLWNELLFGLLIMQDPQHRTLTVGLALLNSDPRLGGSPQTPVLAAALALSALPPFLLYMVFNRTLAQGLTAGALK
jgi:raffinose/stachyose/melibiose transport system permease protein